MERTEDGWRVTLEGETAPRSYAGLVVANGHHWEPNWPCYPGRFDGEILHSHDVKSKDQLKGIAFDETYVWQWGRGPVLEEPQAVVAARQQLNDLAAKVREARVVLRGGRA